MNILLMILAFWITNAIGQTCSDINLICVPEKYSTLQEAADHSVPGNIVWVANGLYRGFQITKSGTPLSPITFLTRGKNVFITSPANVLSKCNTDGICLKGTGSLQGVHDIVIDGFTIQNVYRCISGYDSSPLTNSLMEWPHRRITVRNNLCVGAQHEGFYLNEFNASLIENNVIHHTGTNGLDRGHCLYLANAASDDTTIRNNTLYKCGQAPGSAGMHFNGDASVGGDGIQSGLTISGNVIHDTMQNGLNIDGMQNSVIEGNVVYNVARYAIDAYQMDSSAGPKNLQMVNNIFVGQGVHPALIFTQDMGGHNLSRNIRIQNGTEVGDPLNDWDILMTSTKASLWFKDILAGDFSRN